MSTAAQDPAPVAATALVEPVRQRLLQLAADVLGRLPVEQVPPSLRAVARFTPAKRHRLGGVPIAAALDADAGFRSAVADAVRAASPELVAALQDGAELAATDPLDVAVVAFLTRPEGWAQTVANAAQQWLVGQAPKEAAAGETARLRAELTELRARLRAAEARGRERAKAPADDNAELARLTRELRIRTGELRAAQRARDEALETVAAQRSAAATAAAEHEVELVQLRARVAELDQVAQDARAGSRRAARMERELDDARVRMLIDTLADAAAGLRRELALPASTLRPADAVEGTGGDTDGRRSVDDAAGLERLLGLPQAHLIVDGYNVTKSGYGELPLVDQRNRLTAALATVRGRSGVEVTVAFDGGPRPAAQPRAPRGVRVLFSAQDEIADDLIRRLVAAEPPGRPVIVVTSDQQIVTDVRAAGAWTVPSAVLLALLG
ncbi:NYN domain-containing protein [Jatrophihabitans sp.]|uniref:NYN domain-containing protein n=1 Tax=Jatrophihabitans sp. TaxID=1932789 RepID=UPI0030C6AD4F|nr:RNA-binding protein [Jatrophihabitans sp.]